MRLLNPSHTGHNFTGSTGTSGPLFGIKGFTGVLLETYDIRAEKGTRSGALPNSVITGDAPYAP